MEINDEKGKELIESGEIIIIDFAANWCGPCKVIGPIIEKLAEKYADKVTIGKIDIDDNSDLANTYGVRNIPTILFFKNGEVVDKSVGAVPESKIEEKIENLLNT
jgi:thioredoxin 1